MQLSSWGRQMSVKSGIGSIMDDIATCAAASADDDPWLNLSPGNPAQIPESVACWQQLATDALTEDFVEAWCRYGPARGTPALVSAIVEYFQDTYHWPIGPQNVVVGPGAQQLAFLAATSYTDEQRPLVMPRLPDYAGYQGLVGSTGSIVGIPSRIVLDGERQFHYALDIEAVRAQSAMGMLLLSSPANPTGSSLAPAELADLVSVAEERDIPLFIDNAYGQPFPGVTEAMTSPVWHSHVINCFTLSKAGMPGARFGFVIGSEAALAPIAGFVENTLLHPAQLIQSVARRAFASRQIDMLTEKVIRPYYEAKREAVEELLHDQLPQQVAWRIHANRGGMFCWLWIDEPWFDDLAVCAALKSRRVLIVPGRYFFTNSALADPHSTRCIRVSIGGELELIAEGIRRLSSALDELRLETVVR
jgi:valine--pyruvate aminotransferase